VSVGEVAGLLSAVALLLLVALVAVPLLKLGRMLDEGTKRVEQSSLIIDEAVERLKQGGATIEAVNANLGNVERTTSNVEAVTHNVKAITGVFSATFSGPLVKVAALMYGLSRATKGRR
jgi:uncharacterized protein YoxC